jgi:nucleotide-binding universal stress UspA family protein
LKWNCELIIVSVVPLISPLLVPTPRFNIEKYMSELENAYENVLIEAEEYVKKKSPEIKASTQLGKGRPADIIIKIAEKENVDLIVMGSRGYGRITGWILGSTSRHVVEHCTKPILIIK